jgi:hypothetical protein
LLHTGDPVFPLKTRFAIRTTIMAFASQLNGEYADLIDASRTAFFGSASMVRSKSSLFDSLMPPRPSARLQLVAPQPLTAPRAITAAQFVDGLAA